MKLGCSGNWLPLALPLLALGGCAGAREVGLADLVQEGRANELAALSAHKEQQLRVAGAVVRTGMKRVGSYVGSATRTWGGADVEMSEIKTGYPYLYANDPRSASGGQLLCFFSPDQLEHVAPLKPGDQVIVTGDFQEYADGGATVVLNTCELE